MKKHHLKFFDQLRLSTRIFAVKPARTFLTILGTAVGISTVVFLVSLGYGFQYILLGKLVTTQDSLSALSLSYPSEGNLTIDQKVVDDAKTVAHVSETSRAAEFSGELHHDQSTGLVLVDPIDENYFRLSGTSPSVGSIPKSGEGGVVVSAQALKLLNLPADLGTLGSKVSLKISYQDGSSGTSTEAVSLGDLPITGILGGDSNPPEVFVNAGFLSQPPPFYKELIVKADAFGSVESLRQAFTQKGFLISARLDLVNQANKIMNAITIVLAVFGVTALVVSAIGMFNTMLVGFLERIYEVGIMKSLGATDRDVRNLFLMESLIMGVSGGVMGVLLGVSAGKLLNFLLNMLATRMGGSPLNLFITPLWFVGMIIGTSAFIGVTAGLWPAHRASTLSPKEAFVRK